MDGLDMSGCHTSGGLKLAEICVDLMSKLCTGLQKWEGSNAGFKSTDYWGTGKVDMPQAICNKLVDGNIFMDFLDHMSWLENQIWNFLQWLQWGFFLTREKTIIHITWLLRGRSSTYACSRVHWWFFIINHMYK